MSLKEYRTDAFDLPREEMDPSSPSTEYMKDRNALKIDKLSTRVTIITLLLPIFIGVILFFIYLDMKDQVMEVDTAKNTQVDHVSRQMEEKMNALDIRIAKNRFDLDEKLPALEKKNDSLAQQLAKLSASKADVNALDEGFASIEKKLSRQEQRIQNNADQDQANLAEIERINSTLLASLAENRNQFKKEVQALKQELASLQALEQKMASLETLTQELTSIQNRMDDNLADLQSIEKMVGLLKEQVSGLENQIMSRTEISRRLMALKSDVDQSLADLKKQIQAPPPLSMPEDVSEQNLTQ
jgi:DNA repair exonuclease SbcCD ATPase subunit